jgi:uncharacterized protein
MNEIEKILLSILIAYLIAQISKALIYFRATKSFSLKYFFLENGGMPSTHTSTTSALTIGILLYNGFSIEFLIAAMLTVIVMNDAMKVRFETGEEAKILNKILAKEDLPYHKLSERVGHTPIQVFIGFILGAIAALILYAF